MKSGGKGGPGETASVPATATGESGVTGESKTPVTNNANTVTVTGNSSAAGDYESGTNTLFSDAAKSSKKDSKQFAFNVGLSVANRRCIRV